MKYSLYPLRQINPVLITSMAKLHESALRILLSDMGFPFVLRYFQVAVKDPFVIGFYAMSEANAFVGYVVGTPKPDELNSQLTKPRLWFLGQCFRLIFTRPMVFRQAIISSLKLSKQIAFMTNAIELVYISVDPQARGNGIGRVLAKAFQDASREAGYKRVFASQEVENSASIGLFKSMGYKVISTFREGQYNRQRTELIL
jgi:ribosomal protein S18 acetylase RimI-like enzyme